jgi:hypothetical protein
LGAVDDENPYPYRAPLGERLVEAVKRHLKAIVDAILSVGWPS